MDAPTSWFWEPKPPGLGSSTWHHAPDLLILKCQPERSSCLQQPPALTARRRSRARVAPDLPRPTDPHKQGRRTPPWLAGVPLCGGSAYDEPPRKGAVFESAGPWGSVPKEPVPSSVPSSAAARGTGPPGGPTKRRTFRSPECGAARALTRAWTAGGAPWGPDVLRLPELRPVSGSPSCGRGRNAGGESLCLPWTDQGSPTPAPPARASGHSRLRRRDGPQPRPLSDGGKRPDLNPDLAHSGAARTRAPACPPQPTGPCHAGGDAARAQRASATQAPVPAAEACPTAWPWGAGSGGQGASCASLQRPCPGRGRSPTQLAGGTLSGAGCCQLPPLACSGCQEEPSQPGPALPCRRTPFQGLLCPRSWGFCWGQPTVASLSLV